MESGETRQKKGVAAWRQSKVLACPKRMHT